MSNSGVELDVQNPEGFEDIPSGRDFLRWVRSAVASSTPCSVTLRVVGMKEAQELNRQFRNRDYATNVLSFPFEEPPIPMDNMPRHLGDLVLCKQVVDKEASEQHKAVPDHWTHLVIHGALHLQGYDHITDEQAKIMEALEIKLLKQLGISNPYQ